MTKHRRPRRRRGRCGKIMYRDELAAKLALAETIRRDRGECRIYECNLCYGGVWHVTSQAVQRTEKKTGKRDPRSIDGEVSLAIG